MVAAAAGRQRMSIASTHVDERTGEARDSAAALLTTCCKSPNACAVKPTAVPDWKCV